MRSVIPKLAFDLALSEVTVEHVGAAPKKSAPTTPVAFDQHGAVVRARLAKRDLRSAQHALQEAIAARVAAPPWKRKDYGELVRTLSLAASRAQAEYDRACLELATAASKG